MASTAALLGACCPCVAQPGGLRTQTPSHHSAKGIFADLSVLSSLKVARGNGSLCKSRFSGLCLGKETRRATERSECRRVWAGQSPRAVQKGPPNKIVNVPTPGWTSLEAPAKAPRTSVVAAALKEKEVCWGCSSYPSCAFRSIASALIEHRSGSRDSFALVSVS